MSYGTFEALTAMRTFTLARSCIGILLLLSFCHDETARTTSIPLINTSLQARLPSLPLGYLKRRVVLGVNSGEC